MGKVQQTNEGFKTYDVALLKSIAKTAPEKVAFDLRRLADLVSCMSDDELVLWKEFITAQIISQATDIAQKNVKSEAFNGLSFAESSLSVATNILYNMSNDFIKKVRGDTDDNKKEEQ